MFLDTSRNCIFFFLSLFFFTLFFKAWCFGVGWAANLRQRLESVSPNAVSTARSEVGDSWPQNAFRGHAAIRNNVFE